MNQLKKVRKHLTNAPIAVVFALAIFLAGAPSAPITEVFPVASSVGIAHASVDCHANPECGPYDLGFGDSLLRGAGWIGFVSIGYNLITGRDLLEDLRDLLIFLYWEMPRDNLQKLTEDALRWCERDAERCQDHIRQLLPPPPTAECRTDAC